MDLYHIWCDLKPGERDVEFAEHVGRYLGELRDDGLIADFRVTRRKLGFGAPGLGEFHVIIETREMVPAIGGNQLSGNTPGSGWLAFHSAVRASRVSMPWRALSAYAVNCGSAPLKTSARKATDSGIQAISSAIIT